MLPNHYILHNLQLVKQLKILKMKWARPYLIEVKTFNTYRCRSNFYEKSKEIVALYDYLPSEMERLNGLETGHINMGMSAVMNMKILINILGAFHQQYPNVTYNLIENGGKRLSSKLSMMK